MFSWSSAKTAKASITAKHKSEWNQNNDVIRLSRAGKLKAHNPGHDGILTNLTKVVRCGRFTDFAFQFISQCWFCHSLAAELCIHLLCGVVIRLQVWAWVGDVGCCWPHPSTSDVASLICVGWLDTDLDWYGNNSTVTKCGMVGWNPVVG